MFDFQFELAKSVQCIIKTCENNIFVNPPANLSMNETQFHLFRLSLTIIKTSLSVRFPCSINYTLKNDSKTVESKSAYELKNGVCQPNQRLYIETQVQTMGDEYFDASVGLCVGMISANGKVPAGSVTVSITQKGQLISQQREQIKSIDKCADKLAKVTYKLKIDFIRSIRKQSIEATGKSASKFAPKINHSASEYFLKQFQPVAGKSHSRIVSKNISLYQKKEKANFNHEKSTSRVGKSNSNRQDNSSKSNSKSKDEHFSAYDSKITPFVQSRVKVNLKQASRDRDRDREDPDTYLTTSRMRMDSKYSTAAKGLSEEQLTKYKQEIQELTLELNLLKQKNRNLERRQRDQTQLIRQLRDQIEKLKSKSTTADSAVMEHKFRIEEKDRTIYKLQEELKILKDYVEEIKVNSSMQEKKIDYRENAFAEQVKKVNEKYQQSESERQKIMVDMNNMLTEYENREKKNLLQYKDKERVLLEDKNKLSKKIQSLTQNINAQSQTITQLKLQIEELRTSLTTSNRQKQATDLQLLDMLNLYKNSTADLKKMENRSAELETELKIENDVCHQLRGKQKKYEALCQEHNKLKQSQNKLVIKVQSLTKTIRELQLALKDQTTQKQNSSSRTVELTRQLQSHKKSLQSQESENQSLRAINTKLQSRLDQQSQKYSTEVYLLQQQKKKMEGDIMYLMKTKENLMNDFEQAKWRIEKLEKNQNNLRDKVAEQSEKILSLSSQAIDMQGKLKNQKQVAIELQNSIQLLKSELLSRQTKQRQLTLQLKLKSESEIENIKNIRNKEHELHLAKEKQRQLTNNVEDMRKKIQQLTKQIGNAKFSSAADYDIISKQLQDAVDRRDELTKQIERVKEQCRYQKSAKTEFQRRVTELQSELATANRMIKDYESKIQEKSENEKKNNLTIKSKDGQLRNIKQQLGKYKTGMYSLWQNFTSQFIKDVTLETFTISLSQKSLKSDILDQSLANLLTKMFKLKIELQDKINTLTQNYEELSQNHQAQVDRLRQNIADLEERFEGQLKQEKLKQKQLFEKSSIEKNDQLTMISTLEEKVHELLTEKQRLALQLQSSLQDQVELEATIKKYTIKQTELENTIQKFESDRRQQLKQIEYLKVNANSELKQANQEYKIVVDKQKVSFRDLERKLQKHEESLQTADAQVRLLEDSLAEKAGELDRINKNLQMSEAQVLELKLAIKQLKQQINLKQKSISELNYLKQSQSKEIDTLKFNIEDLQLKLTKISQQKLQILNQNRSYQQQIKDFNITINQMNIKYKKQIENEQKMKEGNLKQIKQRDEQIISLNSDLELKLFMIQQLELSLNELKLQNLKFMDELNIKKQEIKSLNGTIELYVNQKLILQQNYHQLKTQKQTIQENLSDYKQKIQTLSKQSSQKSFIKNVLEIERKQAEKVKNELVNSLSKVEALSNELKVSSTQYKKQIVARTAREEEMKKKIRDFQKQIANKSYEGEMEIQKKMSLFNQEREELIHELELYEQENARIKIMYENLRDKYQKEVERLNQECAELTGLITEKQQILCSKDDKIAQKDSKIKLLTLQLKQCLETWEIERRQLQNAKIGSTQQKADRIMSQVEARSKVLLNGMQRRSVQFNSTF